MKKSTGPIEILLVIIIAVILIIPHVVGETTVMELLRLVGLEDKALTYYGEDRNPFDSADTVSLALIRNACSSYSYDYKDGKCIVKSSMVL